MLGYHKRSDPATEYARAAIDALRVSGSLGSMTYIRILMPAGDWVAHGFDELIVRDDPPAALELDETPAGLSPKRRANYVTFVNYYIHQVNLLRFLLAEPYRPVFADRGGRLLVAESESRITGTIEMSPYRTSIAWQEEVLVCFEHGWIKLTLPAPLALNRPGSVTIYADPAAGSGQSNTAADSGDGGVNGGYGDPPANMREAPDDVSRIVNAAVSAGRPLEISPTLPWIHAMKNQAANFLAAVRGERPPTTDATEALEDLIVAEQYLDLLDAAQT
jgi:predicted dehydrogenase